jgi:hypothetical protein
MEDGPRPPLVLDWLVVVVFGGGAGARAARLRRTCAARQGRKKKRTHSGRRNAHKDTHRDFLTPSQTHAHKRPPTPPQLAAGKNSLLFFFFVTPPPKHAFPLSLRSHPPFFSPPPPESLSLLPRIAPRLSLSLSLPLSRPGLVQNGPKSLLLHEQERISQESGTMGVPAAAPLVVIPTRPPAPRASPSPPPLRLRPRLVAFPFSLAVPTRENMIPTARS